LDESAEIARARAGDRAAFDVLARAHLPRVYSVLFRLLGNHEDAEDLAQESFVRAFGSLRFYRGEGPFGAWLLRIAVHLARDHARSPRGRGASDITAIDLEGSERAPWQELSQRELSTELARSIASLPEPLRVALVLRVLEGMDYGEVARVTGLRPGTVRTQVMKARKVLARLLAPFFERRMP
jgi:RNA polymerase sigma-70 factor (ECF subfamily)